MTLFLALLFSWQSLEFVPDLKESESAFYNTMAFKVAWESANASGGYMTLPGGTFEWDPPAYIATENLFTADGITGVFGPGSETCTLVMDRARLPDRDWKLFALQQGSQDIKFSGFTLVGMQDPDFLDPEYNPDNEFNTYAFYVETHEVGTIRIEDVNVRWGFENILNGNRNQDNAQSQALIIQDCVFESIYNCIAWFSASQFPPTLFVNNVDFWCGSPANDANLNGLGRGGCIYIHPNVPTHVNLSRFWRNYRRAIQFNGSANPDVLGAVSVVENSWFGPETYIGILASDLHRLEVRNTTFLGHTGIDIRDDTVIENCKFFTTAIGIQPQGIDSKDVSVSVSNSEFRNCASVAGSSGSEWLFYKSKFSSDAVATGLSALITGKVGQSISLAVNGSKFTSKTPSNGLQAFIRVKAGTAKITQNGFQGLSPLYGAIMTESTTTETESSSNEFNIADNGASIPGRAFRHDVGLLFGHNNGFNLSRLSEGVGVGDIEPRRASLSIAATETLTLSPNANTYWVTVGEPIKTITFGNFSDVITGPVRLFAENEFYLIPGGSFSQALTVPAGTFIVLKKQFGGGWFVQAN